MRMNFPTPNYFTIRNIAKRRFVKNVAVLSSGQAIAQLLAIAASPILTRLYGPDAFGSFGLLFTLSSTLVVISGLRYDMAIVIAKDDQTAANLLILTVCIVLLTSVLAAILAALGGQMISSFVKETNFTTYIWWLPVLTMVGGMEQLLSSWSTRKEKYRRVATSRVIQSVASITLQLVGGLASSGPVGLLAGRTLGTVIGTINLATQALRQDHFAISTVKASNVWTAAKDNSNFAKYNAPQNLINSLSKTFVPYTLALFFGIEIVGFYYLAQRVINTPSAFFAGSLRRVYYQRASQLHNQGKSFRHLQVSTIAGLFAIAFVPSVVIAVFGPELFTLVFGAEWQKAGVLVQWLVCWWFVAFIASPAIETLTILNIQRFLLFYQISLSAVRFLAILVGAWIGDDILAIAASSVVGVIFNMGLMLFALIAVQKLPTSRRQKNAE